MKYKADKIPKHTLMIKYLKQIMTPAEFRDLLKRYVALKKKTLTAALTKES